MKLIKNKKRVLFFLIVCFSFFNMNSQSPSFREKIRIPLWAELDAYPEWENAAEINDGTYTYPIERLKVLSDFLITGMVYGWNFEYTPSDKIRGVEEFLEINPIQSLETSIHRIEFSDPALEEDRMTCWCEYVRTESEIKNLQLWSTIEHPSVQGKGYGDLIDGFDGIKKAASEAVKNAVREYYRKIIRNKPKEISGSVIIRKTPLIGVDQGRYVIFLDFFMECDRIIYYQQY